MKIFLVLLLLCSLIASVSAEWQYSQEPLGLTLSSEPFVYSVTSHNGPLCFDLTVYPLMISGTKYYYTEHSEDSFAFIRPYEWSQINITVLKGKNVVYQELHSGFTSSNVTIPITVYDDGRFNIYLSGQYAKVSFGGVIS